MRLTVATASLAALVLTCGSGCSHGKTQATPGNQLAARVEIPANTPDWVVNAARRMAIALKDPHPDRVRIRQGRVAVIEMWGDFTCTLCGKGPAPGGPPPQGWHAITRLDRRTHSEISFSIG